MKKRDVIISTVLALIIAVLYVGNLPIGLFEINYKDITEGIITTSLNTGLCLIIIFAVIKLFKVNINLRIGKEGLLNKIKETIGIFLVVLIVFTIGFTINFIPLNNKPSIIKVLVEGIVFYLLVATVEELLTRGLALNIFTEAFKNKKHKYLIAIIVSSFVFAGPHIIMVINQGPMACLLRFFYPFALGMYLGYICIKTNNIIIPIIYHFILDIIGGILSCFSNNGLNYNMSCMIIITVFSIIMCVYSFIKARKLDETN